MARLAFLFASALGCMTALASDVVLFVPKLPPAPMVEAWREKGWEMRGGLDPQPGDVVKAVFVCGLQTGDKDGAMIADAAAKGAVLFLGVGYHGGIVSDKLRPWLPVNTWSFKSRLERRGCEIAGDTLPRVSISRRYDMHLPGSAIESPMYRYLPDEYFRDPAHVTRLSVLARADGEGNLPVLVDADVDARRVILFSADFYDKTLAASENFAAWARAVALLPFEKGVAGERLPERRTTLDGAKKSAAREYAIAIEEDESTLGELQQETLPPDGVDGITAYRYVYRPGTAPKVKVRLRNHFNNIAPLATAHDLKWPENPSAAGLNDTAFTDANLRGELKMNAIWCAASAAEQAAELRWNAPVVISGVRLTGFGPYRRRNNNTPKNFTVSADGRPVVSGKAEDFVPSTGSKEERTARFERVFDRGSPARTLRLDVTGLDPNFHCEPFLENAGPRKYNCGLYELEVWGWPEGDARVAKANAELVVERVELESGRRTERKYGPFPIAAFSEKALDLELEPLKAYGPVRWNFMLTERGKTLAARSFDVFFVPAQGPKIVSKVPKGTAEAGLLCTPGWRHSDSFGLGMRKWTQGWGGPNDKTWAMSLDMMEYGSRTEDNPARMFATPARACHYTNPWRRFPNGEWSWDFVERSFMRRMEEGGEWRNRGCTNIHCVGSDRWNGVPVGASFAWDDFVRFDQWLQAHGKPGLKARTRETIQTEIMEEHGDDWQRFELETYADRMLASQRRFADKGIRFNFETHGSFPLCGGELGAKLAKTHIGVGTDVFWELDRQDLWWTLGMRFAVVAVNPDLRSGAYGQWGWVNSEQNPWWFASNGDITVSKRQWYATYFMGRVDLDGVYHPYHELGYGYQGNHGVRYAVGDHMARTRVQNFTTEVRPERASGIGIVVSWPLQEKQMGPKGGRMGFGLYPEKGKEDVVESFRRVYAALVREGVPVAFVTSSHALAKWRGNEPLVLVDGSAWEDWERKAVAAAESRGSKTFSVSSDMVKDVPSARRIAADISNKLGNPLAVSPGLTVVPFVNEGRLFLSVCRQGDDTTPGEITIRPGFFLKESDAAQRVVSLDDGRPLKVKPGRGGSLSFAFPMEPYSGRLLMFCSGGSKKTR